MSMPDDAAADPRRVELDSPDALGLLGTVAEPLGAMVSDLMAAGRAHGELAAVVVWRPHPLTAQFWASCLRSAAPFVSQLAHGEHRAVLAVVSRDALLVNIVQFCPDIGTLVEHSLTIGRAALPANEPLPLILVDGANLFAVPMHAVPTMAAPGGAPS